MTWFKIDDSAHSHPKFIRAGNAALGLWLRCGAYSAQHLLEGHVPGFIAKSFGSPAQAQKLIKVGLWHGAEHDCTRCPQPADGDYIIHDFFEGGRNSTRVQVETARQAAADRQARARVRASANATIDNVEHTRDENRHVNGVRNAPTLGSETPRKVEQPAPQFSHSAAGQGGPSRRDAINGVTTSHTKPSHTTTAGRQEAPLGVRVPPWAQPLIDALADRKINVSWARLGDMQWIAIQELINSRGVDALASIAATRWNPRDPVKFASLLLTIWLEYPSTTPAAERSTEATRDLPPWCEDPDCHPDSRLREIEDTDGLPMLAPCPNCHPQGRRP